MTEGVQIRATVIVPTRNRPKKVLLCLDALLAQTCDDFEVIVIDDGSTDETPAMVRAFAAAKDRIAVRVLRNETPIGANPSRNRGIRESRGRFVAFLDDDCVPRAEWLERLLAGFVDDGVGAVTGVVEDTPARNLAELMFRGTHRAYAPDGVHPTRLVAGNMAVRRDWLVGRMLDEDRAAVSQDLTVSGRGDEEGLFHDLRAAGFEVRFAADAVVVHDHRHTYGSVLRQGFRGGRSASRLVYKYRLAPRLDLLPFVMAYAVAPFSLLEVRIAAVAALLFGAGLGGLLYNEVWRKSKTPWETVKSFPLLVVYYHLRLAGYLYQGVRLRLGIDRLEGGTATRG